MSADSQLAARASQNAAYQSMMAHQRMTSGDGGEGGGGGAASGQGVLGMVAPGLASIIPGMQGQDLGGILGGFINGKLDRLMPKSAAGLDLKSTANGFSLLRKSKTGKGMFGI